MTFTENDISNTGKLKREAGAEAFKIASREQAKLFSMFEEVCEANGQDPRTVLGDMIVRAINSDEYANAVFDEVVEIEKLNTDQMRTEDAKLVRELFDALGLDEDGDDDLVDEMVRDRFEAATSGPMGMMVQEGQNGGGSQMVSSQTGAGDDVKELKREIEELKSELRGEKENGEDEEDGQDTLADEKKGVDDLFDDDGEAGETPSVHDDGVDDTGDSIVGTDTDGDSVDEDVDDVDELFEDSDDGEFVDDDGGQEVEFVNKGTGEELETTEVDEDDEHVTDELISSGEAE